MNFLKFATVLVYGQFFSVIVITTALFYSFLRDKKRGKIYASKSKSERMLYLIIFPLIIVFEIFNAITSIFSFVKAYGIFKVELLPLVYLVSAATLSYILYKKTEKFSQKNKTIMLLIVSLLFIGSYVYFRAIWLPATAKILCNQERIEDIFYNRADRESYYKCLDKYLK